MKNSYVSILADVYSSLVENSEFLSARVLPKSDTYHSPLVANAGNGLWVRIRFEDPPENCVAAARLTLYKPIEYQDVDGNVDGIFYLELHAIDSTSGDNLMYFAMPISQLLDKQCELQSILVVERVKTQLRLNQQ